MSYSAKESESVASNDDSLEDIILDAGDRLSNVAYERYTTGQMTQQELKEVYKLLSEWTARSERLLAIMS